MYRFRRLEDNVVAINLAGELDEEEYQLLVPDLEGQIEEHGEIRLLVDMSELAEVDSSAAWLDAKFTLKHRDDVSKAAIVGDENWQEVATKLFKPLTSGDVAFFDISDKANAMEWLRD